MVSEKRSKFQFTPLHERQPIPGAIASGWDTQFQFTPLHERQRTCWLLVWQRTAISIHASAWEATVLLTKDLTVHFISIHASAWEATTLTGSTAARWTYFNSRLCMRGNDLNQECFCATNHFNSRLCMRGNNRSWKKAALIKISIHASAWEATASTAADRAAVAISIHASAWEATYTQIKPIGKNGIFQFTPLHERQQSSVSANWNMRLFQFTPLHERQHFSAVSVVLHALISIHASTWEATGILPVLWNSSNFNSRLYMRGNVIMVYAPPTATISIHASTWEATVAPTPYKGLIPYFNSRLYMRGNAIHPKTFYVLLYFNSRLYMRGNAC